MEERVPMSADRLAALITDALADAQLIPKEQLEEATRIAATEIEVRLAVGNEVVSASDRSTSRDGELYRRVDEVLHFIWDPIGVAGEPGARNEYESYVTEVVRLLKADGGGETISSYLLGVAVHRMGLGADNSHAHETAAVLINWYESLAKKTL
jgi:hypothetical protein